MSLTAQQFIHYIINHPCFHQLRNSKRLFQIRDCKTFDEISEMWNRKPNSAIKSMLQDTVARLGQLEGRQNLPRTTPYDEPLPPKMTLIVIEIEEDKAERLREDLTRLNYQFRNES